MSEDIPLVKIPQSTQSTDREGRRALVGTTTNELRDECEDDVQGDTATETVRLAVQRYRDQAGPSNKAGRDIARRLSIAR